MFDIVHGFSLFCKIIKYDLCICWITHPSIRAGNLEWVRCWNVAGSLISSFHTLSPAAYSKCIEPFDPDWACCVCSEVNEVTAVLSGQIHSERTICLVRCILFDKKWDTFIHILYIKIHYFLIETYSLNTGMVFIGLCIHPSVWQTDRVPCEKPRAVIPPTHFTIARGKNRFFLNCSG